MAFRRKIWIDSRVQGVLVGRAVLYWFAGLLFFGTALAVTSFCDNPEWTFRQHFEACFSTVVFWLPSAVLILPLILYDIVRLSHQIVGPVSKARKHLRQIVENPNCSSYTLRDDDYWHDLIQPINDVQNHLLSLHVALQQAIQALSDEDASYANKRLAASLRELEKVQPGSKLRCPDASHFQIIEDTVSAS